MSARILAGEEDSSDNNSQEASENKDESESEEATDSSEEEDQEEETMPTKTPTKKSPKKSPGTPKKAAASKTTTAKKKVTITDDDNGGIDITTMLGDMALDRNSPNFCLEIKDPWKRAAFIKTENENQFYEARVDIFLMAPVLPHHVKIDLSKDGTMLEYQRDVPGWFGSHKHFQREWLTEHRNMLWDANNAENMALFAEAQEFKAAYPDMDSGEKVLPTPIQFIPIPFKCKGTPDDLALRHHPFPI